jgi:osmoprotectant transport system permease protein
MSFWEFLASRSDDLIFEGYRHAALTLQCMLVATAIALGVALTTYRSLRWSGLATATASVILTVPSLALLGILIPLVGLGTLPTFIALVLYALLPVLRNAVVGLNNVDPALVDAARGMGMGRLRTLLRIELPLAWPVVLSGIRVSTQMIIGIAALAAYVRGPGFGSFIFDGLSRFGGANALNLALAGTLGIVVLALLFDLAYLVLGRLTTSKGLR